MTYQLESAALKLRRARDHVRTFTRQVQEWLEGEPYRVVRRLEQDGGEHVYRVEVRRTPPPYLGTIVGDVAHNLMSTLDSIAWSLSGDALPGLSGSDRRSIGFPIAKERQHFKDRPIRFVSASAKAAIERSQPYHGEVPEDEPLWVIHELNRVDKHRYTVVVPALTMGSQSIDPGVPYEEFIHPPGVLEHGSELARFRFETPQPDLDMQFRPMVDVALGYRLPAGYLLDRLVEHVEETIVPRFEPFFSQAGP